MYASKFKLYFYQYFSVSRSPHDFWHLHRMTHIYRFMNMVTLINQCRSISWHIAISWSWKVHQSNINKWEMFNRIFLFYFPTFNRINSTNDSYESVKNYVIMPFIVKLVNINFYRMQLQMKWNYLIFFCDLKNAIT